MRAALLAVGILAIVGLASAAPFVPEVIQGAGGATWFQVFALGVALEGGVHDWNAVCAECLIRFTFTGGQLLVLEQGGTVTVLTPGLYEMREFRGLYGSTQEGPGAFLIQVHGLGKLEKLG